MINVPRIAAKFVRLAVEFSLSCIAISLACVQCAFDFQE